jgi:hypothetical protein
MAVSLLYLGPPRIVSTNSGVTTTLGLFATAVHSAGFTKEVVIEVEVEVEVEVEEVSREVTRSVATVVISSNKKTWNEMSMTT